MKRPAEFSLGMVGSDLGLMVALIMLQAGKAFAQLSNIPFLQGMAPSSFGSDLNDKAIMALVFVAIGFAGSMLVNFYPKFAGGMLIIAAVGGLLTLRELYIPALVLLLPAGFLALIHTVPDDDDYDDEGELEDEKE